MTKNVIAAIGTAAMLLISTACASTTPPRTPQPATTAPALPDSLLWVRDSAEYRAATLQTYRAATSSVTAATSGKRTGSWAVVLDADETIISNLQYQIERSSAGLKYSSESWRAWVARREATPIPGAATFLARVRELGGRIVIVTNRLESECADTEALFKTERLTYDVMLCRPDGGTSDKNPRFAAVAAGTSKAGGPPLEIVAFLGDNILDFPVLTQGSVKQNAATLESFGVKYFIVPNPMYGSWQQ